MIIIKKNHSLTNTDISRKHYIIFKRHWDIRKVCLRIVEFQHNTNILRNLDTSKNSPMLFVKFTYRKYLLVVSHEHIHSYFLLDWHIAILSNLCQFTQKSLKLLESPMEPLYKLLWIIIQGYSFVCPKEKLLWKKESLIVAESADFTSVLPIPYVLM